MVSRFVPNEEQIMAAIGLEPSPRCKYGGLSNITFYREPNNPDNRGVRISFAVTGVDEIAEKEVYRELVKNFTLRAPDDDVIEERFRAVHSPAAR